jgi:hypothetical protein
MEQNKVAMTKREQTKRYAIFLVCAVYLVILFFRNFPATGPLAGFSRMTTSLTYGIGVNHFGWNMFAGGSGISHNQLARVRFTTLHEKATYIRSAWNEFSYKVLQGDARIRDGYLFWYCRNGYGGLPLQSVAIEQAWVPLEDWTRANHTYLTPPKYIEVARVTCSSQN